MSRRHREEFEAGSDSFLDVIANIVGILIILIVVVGAKMGMSPVGQAEIEAALAQEATLPEDSPAPAASEEAMEEPARFDEPTTPERVEEPIALLPVPDPRRSVPSPEPPLLRAPDPEPEPPAPRLPSPELEAEVAALRRTIAGLEAKEAGAAELIDKARAAQQKLEGQLARADESARSAAKLEAATVAQVEELRVSVDDIAARLAAARRKLEALEKTKPPAAQIKHKVTPVSRTVKGEEMHFHLAKGKVTPVPLDDMVERLRTQVTRQKEWLAKYRRHQGELGPIGGFTMQYVVERQDSSVVDDLRDGTATMRIGISQWQLIPEKDMPGETVAQALRPGSAFQRALRQAKPDTTLTFWVYPDSFPLNRALTEFAHREGYTVAARPLPEGLRIAGSPNGSKSAGQ